MPGCGIEVLPGQLVWQPENRSPGSVLALDLCADEGGKPGQYRVLHYSRGSTGAAFGPLDLGSLVRFCRGLAKALDNPDGPLKLTTPEGDVDYLANASVLLGAYLVLRHGWSVAKLSGALGSADAKFACSWATPGTRASERVMSVRDCWLGVALAVKQGWLSRDMVTDDASADKFVEQYNSQALTYDAAWLIPGMLMVGADPMTVIFDPNPATCERLSAEEAPDSPVKKELPESPEASTRSASVVSISSVDTVCKEYCLDEDEDKPVFALEEVASGACDYVSFFRRSGISLVLRANFDFEPGLPQGRSYGNAFAEQGLEQVDVRVVDHNGGLPRRRDVARMLEACEGFMEPRRAVFVHCKGGFGRSVVLACCLAIYRLDVPGSALLGWVRIARPGAITTRAQELFLQKLSGSKDVARYAGFVVATSCTGCSTQ